MSLGARVDDALTTYYRDQLARGERLTLDQLRDAYRDTGPARSPPSSANRGAHFDVELHDPPRSRSA